MEEPKKKKKSNSRINSKHRIIRARITSEHRGAWKQFGSEKITGNERKNQENARKKKQLFSLSLTTPSFSPTRSIGGGGNRLPARSPQGKMKMRRR
jgi:hypothetical protein